MRPIDADALKEKFAEILESTYTDDYAKGYVNGLRAALNMPTLTQPNEWVSVYDRLPEPGERVLATDCGFVGEFYINKRGKWQRYNVNCSELLMALDILYWMPLPAPPERRNSNENN